MDDTLSQATEPEEEVLSEKDLAQVIGKILKLVKAQIQIVNFSKVCFTVVRNNE